MTTPAANFTWHDISRSLDGQRRIDATRDDLPIPSPVLHRSCRDLGVGGLLLWNKSQDHEGGYVVMLAGQTGAQERVVINNAFWMVSCGALYAASRVGFRSFKAEPDHRVQHAGDTYYAWLVRNDSALAGDQSRETQRLLRGHAS